MAGEGISGQISNWAGGGASVTEGALQTAYGLYLEKKNKRPDYNIPPEIQQNLTEANQRALEGLPAQQKQEYINNLQNSTAYATSNLGSLNAGLRGVAGANNQMNVGYGNLMSSDSAARANNQNAQYGMGDAMANYTDKKFQLNSLNPYYEGVAKSQALQGAGMQNISQGFSQGNNGSVDFSKSQGKTPQVKNTAPTQSFGYGGNYGTPPIVSTQDSNGYGLLGSGTDYASQNWK